MKCSTAQSPRSCYKLLLPFKGIFGIISHFFLRIELYSDFFFAPIRARDVLRHNIVHINIFALSLIRRSYIRRLCCSCGNNFFFLSCILPYLLLLLLHRHNIKSKAESDEQIDVCQFNDCIVMLM